jgi:hypothetical protein
MATRCEMSGKAGEIDARLDALADVQTEHDFFERGVAAALAETVDRRVEVRRAGAGGGQRVGRGHPEVVVGMHLDFQIARAQMADALEGREGVEHAQRIGKADALGTRRLRRFGNRRQQVRVAARGVLGTDADAKPRSRARRTCSPICVSSHRRSRCSFECRC